MQLPRLSLLAQRLEVVRAMAQLGADAALAVARLLERRGFPALAMRLHEWALGFTGGLTPIVEDLQRAADEEDKLH